jgi:hypothetical protein
LGLGIERGSGRRGGAPGKINRDPACVANQCTFFFSVCHDYVILNVVLCGGHQTEHIGWEETRRRAHSYASSPLNEERFAWERPRGNRKGSGREATTSGYPFSNARDSGYPSHDRRSADGQHPTENRRYPARDPGYPQRDQYQTSSCPKQRRSTKRPPPFDAQAEELRYGEKQASQKKAHAPKRPKQATQEGEGSQARNRGNSRQSKWQWAPQGGEETGRKQKRGGGKEESSEEEDEEEEEEDEETDLEDLIAEMANGQRGGRSTFRVTFRTKYAPLFVVAYSCCVVA